MTPRASRTARIRRAVGPARWLLAGPLSLPALLLAPLVAAAPSSLAAQEPRDTLLRAVDAASIPAPIPARLTLEDALDLARSRNPAYLEARGSLEVAEARERAGWGEVLPQVRADMGVGGASQRVYTGEDQFGQPLIRDDPLTYSSSSSSQGVGLSMTLFDWGAALQRASAARAGARATGAQVAASWNQLRAEVIGAYDQTLRADRQVALEERLLESARDRLEATRARLPLAVASPVDVLGAEVDVARAEQSLSSARGEARKARLALLELLGVAGEPAFEPATGWPPVFDPATLDVDDLLHEATATSPVLRQREAEARAGEASASAVRRTRWPTLTGGLQFRRAMGASDYGALTELNPRNQNLSFSLGASVQLFDGFARGRQIAQAEFEARSARERERGSRLALERQIRSALIDLENAFRSVELADRAARLAAERLELSQEQYRLGTLSFTELQNVIDQAAQEERQALQARHAFEVARVALEQRVGRELR